MDRYPDIQELLSSVVTARAKLKYSYDEARIDEDIKAVLRPIVKSSLEHLRSCLEYAAQDTHARVLGGNKKLYFPYGKDKREFINSMKNNLPNLHERAPRVYALFESIQPHKSHDRWLIELCKHTNFNKHNRLTKPERVNSLESTTTVGNLIRISSLGSATFENCTFNGVSFGVEKPFVVTSSTPVKDLQAQLPSHIKVLREFQWVEFRFPGTAQDALQLIEKGAIEIANFTSQLKDELELPLARAK